MYVFIYWFIEKPGMQKETVSHTCHCSIYGWIYARVARNGNIFRQVYFLYCLALGIFLLDDFFLWNCLIRRFGRKVVLMASIALYIGSSIPLSFVNEFSEFTVSRIFSGVSVGGLLNTCYVMGKSTWLSVRIYLPTE